MTTSQIPPGGWDRPIPEQPVYQAPLAGWWRRVWASLVDFIIISIPAGALAVVIFSAVGIAFGADEGLGWFSLVLGTIAYLAIFMAVCILYSPLLMRRPGARNGQTLGKQLLRIRVIRPNGVPMDFSWSALREVVVKGFGLGIASAIIPVLPYLLDFLWPLWDDQNRALHDMVCDTRVVQA